MLHVAVNYETLSNKLKETFAESAEENFYFVPIFNHLKRKFLERNRK